MMSTKAIVWLLLAFLIQSKAESEWRCPNPDCHCTFEPTSTENTWWCYHKKPSGQSASPRVETLPILLENGSVHNEPSPNYQIGRSDPEEESLIPLKICFDKAENTLDIDCSHFSIANVSHLNSSVFNSLPQLNLVNSKPISVYLKLCPFPGGESFQSFLQILNVTNVESLTITNSAGNITLSPSYFDGIPYVKSISLESNSGLTELPADLFKETLDLKYLTLRGNKITQLDVNVFRHLKKLKTLDLGNNQISELDPRIFQNLTSLKDLNIDHNRLVNLTRALFTNVPNLVTLDISGIKMSVLESGVFDDLVKLKILHAHKTQFQTFPADLFSKTKELQEIKIFYHKGSLVKLPSALFSNLPNLKKVDIRQTSIEELPFDLFWNSTKLATLSLTGHRKLKTITSELFRDCKELTILDLSDNGFESLPENVFGFLEKLTELNLNGNRLEKITEHMFDGIIKLEKLYLNKNKLKVIGPTSFDFLRELIEIDLSHNMLTFDTDFSYSPLKSCVNLETMQLSHNWISKIYEDWRISFTRLQLLDLTWNNFTIIHDDLHSIVSRDMTMDLSNNQISVVELENLEFVAEQQEDYDQVPNKIILSENPIACNCSNYDLFLFFNKKMSHKVYNMIRIDTPKMILCKDSPYENRSLKSVNPETLRCPNEQCPLSCKCTFAPYYSRMTVDCSSANLTEMPQNLPVLYKNSRVSNIELILSNNSIRELTKNVSKEYARLVTDLDLSDNQVSNGEEFIRRLLKLEKLDLSGNQLGSLSEEFVNLTLASNISSLFLSGNPWQCDCGITELFTFILDRPDIVKDSNKIMCNGNPLNGMSTDYFCPTLNPYFIASITLGSLGVLFGLLVFLYYKFEREIKVWLFAHNWLLCWVSEEDIDHDKEYDAFVCYSEEDYRFVVKTLIPELDKTYKVCHHHRNFIGGSSIADQIYKSVHKSRRTVIVLTEHFVKSYWGMEEFRTAYAQAAKDKCPRIIVIIYKEVPPQESMADEMKSYLNTYTYIKWGEKNNNWFWRQLHYAMPHRSVKTLTNNMAVTKYNLGMNGIGYNNHDTTVLFSPDEKENQPGHFTTQIMKKG
uniref:Protein toll n=1 Tax=Cacopsylla melanoneura TaxID=428564 RepID=A0A8D8UVF7_9HEMI